MSSSLQTDFARFFVFRATYPNAPPRTYLEVPVTMRSMDSLKNATEWIKMLGLPSMNTSGGIVSSMFALAYVVIELPRNRLSESSKRLIGAYKDGCPEMLMNLVKEPAVDLINKLVEQSMNHPNGDSEIEGLEFEILDVAGPGVTAPGMYAEIVHDADIASSIERWSKDVDGLQGSVIGHVSIEIYRNELSSDARSAIERKDFGEPEPLEALIGGKIVDIMRRFVTA